MRIGLSDLRNNNYLSDLHVHEPKLSQHPPRFQQARDRALSEEIENLKRITAKREERRRQMRISLSGLRNNNYLRNVHVHEPKLSQRPSWFQQARKEALEHRLNNLNRIFDKR
jgi:hypothetical protein